MFYYTLKNNKIEQFAEIQGKAPSFMSSWQKTEDKIIRTCGGEFKFEKDVDLKAEAEMLSKIEHASKIEEAIGVLKQQLSSTDYVVTKIAEGVATKEEYADVLAQRAEARRKINDLQAQL